MKRNSQLLQLLFVGCALLLRSKAQSPDNWFPTFFPGQQHPPNEQTNVYFSAFLWRVTEVNELDYTFTAHLRYTLSWKDPNAAELIANATARQRDAGEPCRRPCTNINYPAGDPGVQVPVLDNSVDCCDDIWLPTLLVDNVMEIPQANYYSSCDDLWLPTLLPDNLAVAPQANMYSRISLCNALDEPDAVLWTVKVVGCFYTSMNFRSFPFDRQYLSIVFRVPESINYTTGYIKVVPSVAAISNRFNQGNEFGDELSSFSVVAMYFNLFSESWFSLFRDVNPPAAGDVCAFDPRNNRNGAYVTTNYTSISVVIEVQRYYFFYILTIIFPIFLVGLIAFAVFLFQPSDIVTRFQALITLLLALMAVQFVVNAGLPASSYPLPTHLLIVTTYVLYLLLTLESFLVYKITLTKERHDSEAKQEEAVKIWKQQQHEKAMQRKASYYIGLMKSNKSGTSLPSRKTTAPQEDEDAAADSTVVPVASSSENNLAERSVFSTPPAQSNVSNSKSGGSKGWAALRGAGAAQAAQVVAQEEQEAKTAQRSEGSVRFQVADEDDKREHADNKAFQEWLARRKASNRLRGAESVETEGSVPAVAEEEDSEASAPRGIILCPFLPQFKRKQKKKTRRQTVQEYFYQWRARRYDKILGSTLFVCYVICAVLLFVVPYAMYS